MATTTKSITTTKKETRDGKSAPTVTKARALSGGVVKAAPTKAAAAVPHVRRPLSLSTRVISPNNRPKSFSLR